MDDEEQRARRLINHENKRDAYVSMGLPDPGPLPKEIPEPSPEVRDLDWLRDKLATLFDGASGAAEPDHKVCVEYGKILKELLPGNRGAGTRGNSHPDAATIEQVRLAIQQTTHPVPKSQTEP